MVEVGRECGEPEPGEAVADVDDVGYQAPPLMKDDDSRSFADGQISRDPVELHRFAHSTYLAQPYLRYGIADRVDGLEACAQISAEMVTLCQLGR